MNYFLIKMKRFFKMTLLIIIISAGLIFLSGFLFIKISPQFGASKNEKLTEQALSSKHHNGGVFHNLEETVVMMEFKWSTLKDYFNKDGKFPAKSIPVEKLDIKVFNPGNDSLPRFTWFGHSAILLELEGKNIFIDPMLGNVPAPLPFLGPKRFNPELPITADSIPHLDAVLISHDHYDHLDYKTIIKLKDKTSKFFVPLGVDAHLRNWGVDSNKIHVMDWWDSTSFEGIDIIATPARHFSGRALNDRNTTLWCSFVIRTDKTNIFFSGDSGYGQHFKKIGKHYGPFDLCFMECGQYNEQWAQIHLMPEEIVTANEELGGGAIFPIHWGAFKLSLHGWKEPVDRLIESNGSNKHKILTPVIGETVDIHKPQNYSRWWKDY